MGLLQTLGAGQGYLKAGFMGFQKSGKTYTAIELAVGARRFFGLTGPIAMFDTEGGSEYIAARVKKETGVDLLGVRSRSFADLLAAGRECEGAGVSVLVVDSVTHVWRELCEAYLKEVNFKRHNKGMSQRHALEFQDWSHIKGRWAEWTDFYLNSKLHIVICGRAGYEYDFEENQETGKKELIKTGIKMKTEGEFGFEPSLLVEMERVQVLNGDRRLVHRATVLGDRFAAIDAATCDNPSFDFFRPHVERLVPGSHAPIDTAVKTAVGVDEQGQDEWARERRQRQIFSEEIQGALVAAYPGQTASDKKAKLELLHKVFKTRSWEKIEKETPSQVLRAGLVTLHELLAAADLAAKGAAPASSEVPS